MTSGRWLLPSELNPILLFPIGQFETRCLIEAANREKRDENDPRNCGDAFGRHLAGAAAQTRRRQARHGAFRDIVQTGSAEAFRPGDAVSAFVLVPRVAKAFRGCAEGRSRMRHRLLGHRAQPAVESPRPAAGEESRRGRCRDREGQRASAPRPSASATTSMRSAPCTPTTKRSITARACRPTPRPWNNWHSAIRTMTKRRSIMRSRSTPRLRRPTRPTPISSKARQSWSRSQNASRSIPAWRIT